MYQLTFWQGSLKVMNNCQNVSTKTLLFMECFFLKRLDGRLFFVYLFIFKEHF